MKKNATKYFLDPQWQKHVFAALEREYSIKIGTEIGRGMYGFVFNVSGQYNGVIKITQTERGNRDADVIRKILSISNQLPSEYQKHIPKFYIAEAFKRANIAVIIMERLENLSSKNSKILTDLLPENIQQKDKLLYIDNAKKSFLSIAPERYRKALELLLNSQDIRSAITENANLEKLERIINNKNHPFYKSNYKDLAWEIHNFSTNSYIGGNPLIIPHYYSKNSTQYNLLKKHNDPNIRSFVGMLLALQKKGIIYSDIINGNVMQRRDGTLCIMDVGLFTVENTESEISAMDKARLKEELDYLIDECSNLKNIDASHDIDEFLTDNPEILEHPELFSDVPLKAIINILRSKPSASVYTLFYEMLRDKLAEMNSASEKEELMDFFATYGSYLSEDVRELLMASMSKMLESKMESFYERLQSTFYDDERYYITRGPSYFTDSANEYKKCDKEMENMGLSTDQFWAYVEKADPTFYMRWNLAFPNRVDPYYMGEKYTEYLEEKRIAYQNEDEDEDF